MPFSLISDTSVANLVEQCDSLGYSLTHINENYHAEHFQFAKKELNTLESGEDSFDATEISLKGAFPYTKSSLEYDAATGFYKKNLYESPQTDGATGEQLTFENVIVQIAYSPPTVDFIKSPFDLQTIARYTDAAFDIKKKNF